jgi:sterol desaturase/sphingolipid hydroxylase (fatty acid hydroxylase superfamily)
MDVNYIALAVPFFFLCIGIELLAARRRGRRVYRFGDALIDLSTGVTQQMTLLFGNAVLLAGYVWLWNRVRILQIGNESVAAWIFTFFAVDFIYYWWHRLSHEVNLLWAAHVTHHSSEDYNLAVALRQSIFTSWTSWPFYALLAFVGIPPLMWLTVQSFSTLYQFWIHTELIGKLGRFERVFNAPSPHRVHHAINPRYLDKNYAATLLIWDRLFGTFEPESEPPVYGLVKPLRSFDPLWAQVHYLVELVRYTRKTPRAVDKLKVWLRGPTWSPPGLLPLPPPPAVSPSTFVKYQPQERAGLRAYLLLHFAILIAATFFLMLRAPLLPPATVALGAALVILTVFSAGALLESRAWAVPFEVGRLVLVGAAAVGWAWRFIAG